METDNQGQTKLEKTNEHDALGFRPSGGLPRLAPLTPGQPPEDECYDMSHANRGIALIFNHQHFDDPYYHERKGTEYDRDALNSVLKGMGFHVEIHNDATLNEIMETLTIVSRMDHTSNDCLVVAVMTHGRTLGRLKARDREYTTNQLVEFFSGDRCPSLAGKPKLFFIQACRGEKTDAGVKIESDSMESRHIIYTVPAMADILIMYATVEGYYAWRDSTKGSCFIQSLARKLETYHKRRDLLSILTMVNREVAIGFESRSPDPEFNQKKEMCSIVSMLTRTLIFE